MPGASGVKEAAPVRSGAALGPELIQADLECAESSRDCFGGELVYVFRARRVQPGVRGRLVVVWRKQMDVEPDANSRAGRACEKYLSRVLVRLFRSRAPRRTEAYRKTMPS
jgi:hypothetical protein